MLLPGSKITQGLGPVEAAKLMLGRPYATASQIVTTAKRRSELRQLCKLRDAGFDLVFSYLLPESKQTHLFRRNSKTPFSGFFQNNLHQHALVIIRII